MTSIAPTSAGAAGLSAMRRGQASMRAEAVQADRREQVLERVDRLVRGMESVARRLSSEQVSSTQRSVLVSRFNDMQRRVNQLDGVVGSEGRGDRLGQVGASSSLAVDTPEAAEQTFRQMRQVRRELQVERRPAPAAQEPAPSPRPAPESPAPQQVAAERQGGRVDLEA